MLRRGVKLLVAVLLLCACNGYKLADDFCDDSSSCVCDMVKKRCASAIAQDGGSDRPGVDAAPPDTRPPDAEGSCGVSADCRDPAAPHCVSLRCVQCTSDDHCTGDAARSFCVANVCSGCDKVPADACGKRDPRVAVCGPAGQCLQCTSSSHCTDAVKPICQSNKCGRCTTDAQCADKLGANPGVCMSHQDGRCASEGEAIYVQRAAGCSTGVGVGGTAAVPYCRPQLGLDAVSESRRVVVLRGPDALSGWAGAISGKQVSVIGQGGVVLGPSIDTLVRLSGGNLYLRSLTIAGSMEVGVQADGEAVIGLHRCVVKDNAKGGLLARGAGFDVSNSVFDGNGPGLVGTSAFGGAYLGPASAPAQFRNNTVVSNKVAGVLCEKSAQAVTGLLLYMNQTFDTVGCVVTSSKAGEDPKFDLGRPYHLTASSPCIGAGDAADFPEDDIDGEVRPKDLKSDCGADEF